METHTGPSPCHRALIDLLKQLPQDVKDRISSICIDGTSSTALLVDSRRGDILAPTKIYNEDQGAEAFEATKVGSHHADHHTSKQQHINFHCPNVGQLLEFVTFYPHNQLP